MKMIVFNLSATRNGTPAFPYSAGSYVIRLFISVQNAGISIPTAENLSLFVLAMIYSPEIYGRVRVRVCETFLAAESPWFLSDSTAFGLRRKACRTPRHCLAGKRKGKWNEKYAN